MQQDVRPAAVTRADTVTPAMQAVAAPLAAITEALSLCIAAVMERRWKPLFPSRRREKVRRQIKTPRLLLRSNGESRNAGGRRMVMN
jgi:hypothetical protein